LGPEILVGSHRMSENSGVGSHRFHCNQIKEFNDLYPIKLKLSHGNQYHLFIFMFNTTFNNISHFKGFYLYFIILRIEMDGGGCFQGHTNIKYLYF
jgi:hypothetical protein